MPPDETEEEDDTPATVDVLKYGVGESAKYVTVPSGTATMVVAAHRRKASRSRLIRTLLFVALALATGVAGTLITDSAAVGFLAVAVVAGVGAAQEYLRVPPVPEIVDEAALPETAEKDYDIEFHVDEPFKQEIVE